MNSKFSLAIFSLWGIVGCIILGVTSAQPMEKLYHIGYFTTIELLLFIWLSYKTGWKSITYSTVFVFVLFIFHFGQLVLYTFFQDVYSHIRFLLLLSPENSVHGFLYITYSFTAICIGMMIRESGKPVRKTSRDSYFNTHCDWGKVAKTIIYWTFWVKVILDVATLVITITAGGEVARMFVNRFPNVFLYYGKISLVGFALLILVYKESPRKQLRTFLFIEIYILVMMISGIRSENVAYLVIFFFVFISSREKISIRKIVIGVAVAAVFVLPFVVAVGHFRTAANRNLDTLSEIYKETEQEDTGLLGLLDNCGDTGYTSQAVINGWLPKYGPTFGESYYTGIVAIIPNIPGILDMGSVTKEGAFALKLQDKGVLDDNYFNIGASVIGELFMNWGLIGGIIASFIFGLFIGWISQGIRYCFNNKNYYCALLYIPLMLASLYWVRSYFGGCVREAVWGILFAYLIARQNAKKGRKKMVIFKQKTLYAG